MTYRILVGSYTDDVYTLDFDPSSESLNLVAKTKLGTNPSWITQHPNDHTLIFAALEQTEGKVVAVKFDEENGKGRIVGEASSGGADPCSVLATENELIVANVSTVFHH
jgi:6-phosphogluconolactonase (cycloisomerase 2 family)